SGDQKLFGSTRVRRALEHDELSGTQVRCNRACGRFDEAEVGLMMIIERRGYADDYNIHVRDPGVVGRGAKATSLRRPDLGFGNAHNIRATQRKCLDLLGVYVKASDFEPLLAEQQRQGQANVAQPDDTDLRRTVFELVRKGLKGRCDITFCSLHY